MIERVQGLIAFYCDACGDSLETHTRDFSEANAIRREERWSADRDEDGDWTHFCGYSCAAKGGK